MNLAIYLLLFFIFYISPAFSNEPFDSYLTKTEEENGKQILYRYAPNSHQLQAKFTSVNNRILWREFYFYNTTGQIIKICFDDGSSENIDDFNNVSERRFRNIFYQPEYLEKGLPEIIEETCLDLSTGNEILIEKMINHYNAQAQIIQQDFHDSNNQLRYSIYYEYDSRERLIRTVDATGNILEKSYDLNDSLLKITSISAQGLFQETKNVYDISNRLISTEVLDPNNNLQKIHFQYDVSGCLQSIEQNSNYEPYTGISYFLHTINDFINTHLSLEHNLKSKIEDVALIFFSKTNLGLMGFYLDKQEIGTFGHGEINDRVRITLINGILNARHDLDDTLETISHLHGNNNIHYIFRPTEGWTWDIVKSTLAKFGWASPQAHQLAEQWRALIAEMGGVQGGGKIIHYAHSIGAIDTLAAKSLLSPEELNVIQVYTFGSPSILHPGGFHSVKNYVSRGDGICYLDPIQYIRYLIEPIDHVTFLPSAWSFPFIDHPLTFPTYQSVLETLGKQFLEFHA